MSTKTIASAIKFSELTGLLEKIKKIQGKSSLDQKKRLLSNFIAKWREAHNTYYKGKATDDSFYSAMRLIMPHLEKERGPYGTKETMLAKSYISILQIGEESADGRKLKHFSAPKHTKGDESDFAGVAYYVLKDRLADKTSLTIQDVNDALDAIALANANKDKVLKEKKLLYLLQNTSALDNKWLIRMILRDMKLGFSQHSVFTTFHQDAEDYFNVCTSLQKVCQRLHNPSVRMHEIEITVFEPFRPMLGDRGQPNKVESLFGGKEFFIETKYDGERMQLHKDKDEYKYFSRGGLEYSKTYGANAFDGNFTPQIHNCFLPEVKSCILDGEMMAYDASTDTIMTKGGSFDVKVENLFDKKGYTPCMSIFDVLMFNGKVLTNLPLRERVKYLEEVLVPVQGRIMLGDRKLGKTKQDCADALNNAIDNREEGIMVKDPESIYKPNVRTGGWYKIKPEYVGGLMDELDLLIVGGYMGKGRRSNMMSHFLCAVAVPTDDGSHPKVFHSFCKVGTGYSIDELRQFNDEIDWLKYNKDKAPDCIVLAQGFKEKPDAWVPPSKAYIVQVKAAEITASRSFKTGYTLRFPRVEKFRTDKNWYDCMTTTELEDLRNKSQGKLAGRHADVSEESESPKKKRKLAPRQERATVASQFRGIDTSTVLKISEMFAGKEFSVINGSAKYSKQSLEKKIVEYGGTIVQNPSSDTYCVLAEKVALKVKNLISRNIYDIVKVDWFVRCFESNTYIPWVPSDMIHTSAITAERFAQEYDRYGDSYYNDTGTEQIKQAFAKIGEEKDGTSLMTEDVAEIEMKYFPDECPLGIFRLARVYVDVNHTVNNSESHIPNSPLEITSLDLRFYGATIADTIDDDVSHVVLHSGDVSRVKKFRDLNRKRDKKFHILTDTWVLDSIKSSRMMPERGYEPHC
ncbi:unnamed protein product [Owenia fusiformis]|uniref:DNA ligase n=1 Tax=Owenia fusiformis TaxID=6347 RepID=A0A8J1U9I2_OWEFU|nr:unnamed protein product [Owenia fusiformis]